MDISNLDLLRLDLTNCRCPVGCCRMGPFLLEILDANPQHEDCGYPKRVEILGILEREQHACRDVLAQRSGIPLDRVFFVDNLGCTCKLSPSIYGIPLLVIDRLLRKERAVTASPERWLKSWLKAWVGDQVDSPMDERMPSCFPKSEDLAKSSCHRLIKAKSGTICSLGKSPHRSGERR